MWAGTFGSSLPHAHGRGAWKIHLEALVEDDQASLHHHLSPDPSIIVKFGTARKAIGRRGV